MKLRKEGRKPKFIKHLYLAGTVEYYIHITLFCPPNYPTRLIFYSNFYSDKEGAVTIEVKEIIPKVITKTDLGFEPITNPKCCSVSQ